MVIIVRVGTVSEGVEVGKIGNPFVFIFIMFTIISIFSKDQQKGGWNENGVLKSFKNWYAG